MHAPAENTVAVATEALVPSASHAQRLTYVFAAACGLSVANLYYNQPLLADMARAFGVTVRGVGFVPTLTQLGYALGLLTLVPLGDVFQRRRLVGALLFAAFSAFWATLVFRMEARPLGGALSGAALLLHLAGRKAGRVGSQV